MRFDRRFRPKIRSKIKKKSSEKKGTFLTELGKKSAIRHEILPLTPYGKELRVKELCRPIVETCQSIFACIAMARMLEIKIHLRQDADTGPNDRYRRQSDPTVPDRGKRNSSAARLGPGRRPLTELQLAATRPFACMAAMWPPCGHPTPALTSHPSPGNGARL